MLLAAAAAAPAEVAEEIVVQEGGTIARAANAHALLGLGGA